MCVRVARDRQRIVVVHAAEGVLRTGVADRGAQRARHGVHPPPVGIGRQGIEVHDRIEQPGMRRQRPSRRCDHLLHARRCERTLQRRLADEAGGTGQQYTCHVDVRWEEYVILPVLRPEPCTASVTLPQRRAWPDDPEFRMPRHAIPCIPFCLRGIPR